MFGKWPIVVSLLLSLTLYHPGQRLGIRLAAQPSSTVVQQSDISLVGALNPLSVNTTFAYGGISGRIGPDGHKHLFILNNSNKQSVQINIGTSSTVMTLCGGCASVFAPGDSVNVYRAASNNALPENTVITQIATDTVTVSPALSGTPAGGDIFYKDGSYVTEVDLNGLTPSLPYTTSPQPPVYRNWGDVYHGHKVTWDVSGQISGFNGGDNLLTSQLYFNPTTNLLYWCYVATYVTSNNFSCGASALNDTTGAVTSFGPWQIQVTNTDGVVRTGSQIAATLAMHPDGSMLVGAGISGGGTQFPWGPNISKVSSCTNCVNGWPTGTTPSGFGSSNLVASARDLFYYSMATGDASGNYFQANTSNLVGSIRSFSSPYDDAYLYETNYEDPGLDANPANNGGVGTWTEMDGFGGCFWFTGTYKSGILCGANRVGSPTTNVTLCDGAIGAFGGPTHGSSAAKWYETCSPQSQGCTPASDPTNHILCSHGCYPAIVVTGPQANIMNPLLEIFDPAYALKVETNTQQDWQVPVNNSYDLRAAYGITVSDTKTNGGNANNSMGWWDASANNLYMIANLANPLSRPGDISALIYVYHITDAPAPTPAPGWLSDIWRWLDSPLQLPTYQGRVN